MPLSERFADNGGVKIRYLDNDPARSKGNPVVFVPGVTDVADDYVEAFDVFGERRILVIELRGRGGSDTPITGYSALDLASDVEAVIQASAIGRFHLMTFSRGTTPSLEVTFDAPERVLSLSIGDYKPAEVALKSDFAERMMAARWRGKPVRERVSRHAMVQLQMASRSRDLREQLSKVKVPVLVARPTEGGIIGEDVEQSYRDAIPDVEVVVIPGSGHDLFRTSRTAYPEAVLEFVGRRTPGS